jgi:hypothetical protein
VLARYLEYIAAFNARDIPTLERILDPEVVFDWRGDLPTMYGRDQMLGFYEVAWRHFEETLTPSAIEVRGDVLRTTLRTELRVTRDWPDCPLRPFFAGTTVLVGGRLQYVFHRGRINHIMELLDPTSDGGPGGIG